METTTLVTIDVDETSVHQHPCRVCINLVNQIQRLAINSETKTCTADYPCTSSFSQINLELHHYEFSPSYLYSLIDPHLRSPHKSCLIAEEMAYWFIRHTTGVPRQAYRMFVNVVTTENVFVTVPERETQKEEEEEEATCVICLEEMLKDEKMELLFSCAHRFHLRCIGQWLQSYDSCPLCRQNLFD